MRVPGAHVLLVEDDPTFRDVLLALLPQAILDPTVEAVGSMSGALAALARRTPDAIVLDLQLPDSSGLDTLRAVAKAAGDAAILVVTGNADADLGHRALQEGAIDHLVKAEVTRAAIGRSVRHALVKKQLEDERRALRVDRPIVISILRELLASRNAPDTELAAIGRGIAERVAASDIGGFVSAFERMGLGSDVRWNAISPTRYHFEGHALLERRESAKTLTCHMALGYFVGAVQHARGGTPLGTETACQSRGARACTFIVEAR